MTSAEEVKSRLDIVDIVNEYVPLKPAGANWRACCPFHDEKSPSFMVSKPKQIWHCFGCGEGGDLFTFVMKQEGIEFPEALRLLAEKAGVQIHQEPSEKKSERERHAKALETTVQFWSAVLWELPAAKEARRYLQEERHLLPETIRDWQLGYAPDSWEAAVTAVQKKGFTAEDLVAAGVAVRKMEARGRNVYDRFRNRIMFPIADTNGRIVGATGRLVPGSESARLQTEGKYVNTPETDLYHKGRVLYGLHKAKTEIRKQNLAVIVEGNMDVIASHQAGVTNVIAASGTALTEEQVSLLRRYTERLAFSFDTDAAGEAATLKGLAIALGAGFSVMLVELPKRTNGEKYKDPDECVRENPEAWKKAIAGAEPVIDHYLRRASQERDMTKLDDKQAVVRTLLPIIARLPDKVAESHYLGLLARLVQVSEQYLREAMPATGKSIPTAAHSEETPRSKKLPPQDERSRLSERFVAALIRDSKHLPFAISAVPPEYLDARSAALYRLMIVFYTERSGKSGEKSGQKSSIVWSDQAFREHLQREPEGGAILQFFDVLSLLADTEFADDAPVDFERDLVVTSKRLKKNYLRAALRSLEQSIQNAERAGTDPARLALLMQEFQTMSAELVSLDFPK